LKALVTGGAGFIGSNLVDRLVSRGDTVTVLDDLSTGKRANLSGRNGNVELVDGDVQDHDAVASAVGGADVVFHLAARASVARSVEDPMTTHAANAYGTLVVLLEARDAGVKSVVYASSSSIYGDSETLPKSEEMPPAPLSPYAASKLAGEAYCRAFSLSYGLRTSPLRFFNVYGPRQDPNSEYAAVIPRFVARLLDGERPEVFGDGNQTRDFTFVGDAVESCLAAADTDLEGEPVNVAAGGRTSLLELLRILGELTGRDVDPIFHDARTGDVRDSQASIERAKDELGYGPAVSLDEGLRQTVDWFAATRNTC
jgi:UDP-glucose 4-epimerase